MPEPARYQEVIESMKQNKNIEGLAKYTGEHIVGKLDTTETQTIKEILKLLDIKYGRTRLEELEELMEDWIKFNFNEHDNEEEYLFAQEKIISRQNETKVTLTEWNAIWMMHGAKQRKGIESFQLLQLRDILKAGSDEMQKDFVSKYRELKIESNRGRQNTPVNTVNMMRKSSKSRQRYHDQRIRRDSRGRDFYQERRSRNDSRGRQFHRKYYRRDNERHRSFSRDMRSRSRKNRPDERDKRSGS